MENPVRLNLGCGTRVLEGWINFDRAVHEDATQSRVAGGVDELSIADGAHHAFCSAGVEGRVGSAALEVFLQRHLDWAVLFE